MDQSGHRRIRDGSTVNLTHFYAGESLGVISMELSDILIGYFIPYFRFAASIDSFQDGREDLLEDKYIICRVALTRKWR